MAKLRFEDVKADCTRMGLTIRRKDGEFRVNFNGAPEETAYYTNDLTDAFQTAYVIANEMRLFQVEGTDCANDAPRTRKQWVYQVRARNKEEAQTAAREYRTGLERFEITISATFAVWG